MTQETVSHFPKTLITETPPSPIVVPAPVPSPVEGTQGGVIPRPPGMILIKKFPLVRGGGGATTGSLTQVDLLVLNNIRIAQNASILISGSARKGSGNGGWLGLKLNTTEVVSTPTVANSPACLWSGSAIDEPQSGSFWAWFPSREDDSYLKSGLGMYTSYGTAAVAVLSTPCATNPQPKAIITSITITAKTADASLQGVIQVEVWMSGVPNAFL